MCEYSGLGGSSRVVLPVGLMRLGYLSFSLLLRFSFFWLDGVASGIEHPEGQTSNQLTPAFRD